MSNAQRHSDLKIKEQLYILAMMTHPEDPIGVRDRWWKSQKFRNIPNWERRLFGEKHA